MREKIANDKVITLFLNEVSRAVRQLIFGAKLVMQKAKRQKLLCDDLNTFIEMEGGKVVLIKFNTFHEMLRMKLF